MIIYGSTMSPFVRKLVAVISEKGLDFKLKPVGYQDADPAYRAASPLGKMPAMDDDGFGLADSSAIIHYLEAKYPEPAMIPADPQARGRCIWWEEYADTVLTPAGGKIFFNRVVAPAFLKREGNPAIAEEGETVDMPKICDYLEDAVPEPGHWLVDDTLSLADLALASPFVNLSHAGCPVDADKYPRLCAWLAFALARPSLAGSIAREEAFLKKIGFSA
ncbi:glutathione S-transferase family protein [Sphingomicrobium flavum]|uniref:glutathione S-transferase family protein n=1 Tax=Sphingomicrobium flavum TaxID=1229164 RepID=UPI0021ADA907|nr:glutathione S-transferase family protein [Sphingomicrobium flavum]